MTGPGLSDGPLFVTVITALPVPPGDTVGVVVPTARSLCGAVVVMVAGAVLFAVAGSMAEEATIALPPSSVAEALAEEATATSMASDCVAPTTKGPVMVQVMGPAAAPAHPAGSELTTTVLPVGGL
jgi:hypothetical protein